MRLERAQEFTRVLRRPSAKFASAFTQARNRDAARERLVALIQKALVRPRKRRPTKPKAAAREKRLTTKKLRGTVKELRGRARGSDD